MICPICNSDSVQMLEINTNHKKRIEREYECLECLTAYKTRERLIKSSIPSFVQEQAYMIVNDVHVTKKEFDKAQENGISRKILHQRIKNNWSTERAITEPVNKQKKHGEYRKIAESNGISRYTFYARVKRGMDPKEAATKPLKER